MNILMRIAFLSMKQVGFIALAVTGLFYNMMFDDVAGADLVPRINQLQAEVAAEEVKKADTEKTLKERDRLQEILAKLTDRYETLSRQIPTEINDSDLNKQINNLIQAAKVRPLSRKPLGAKSAGVLEELSYNLKLMGGFNDLAQFVYLVSTLEQVMVVKTIKMEPVDANAYDGKLSCEVIVSAYKLSQLSSAVAGQGVAQ